MKNNLKMFSENTLFSIFKNIKLFFVFWLSNLFSYFFCYGEKKTIFENSYQIEPISYGPIIDCLYLTIE